MIIKDIYNDINTPFELLKFINTNIRYGMIGSNKRIYDTSDLDAFELASEIYWLLSSPSNVLKTGYGTLYDIVELERDWFHKHGYECTTLYITYLVNNANSLPTHAYLAFKDNNKWYWFEACDKANIGIHEYNTLAELITDQMTKHVRYTERFNPMDDDVLNTLHIYEYKKPKSGLDTKEFKKFIYSSSEVPIVD